MAGWKSASWPEGWRTPLEKNQQQQQQKTQKIAWPGKGRTPSRLSGNSDGSHERPFLVTGTCSEFACSSWPLAHLTLWAASPLCLTTLPQAALGWGSAHLSLSGCQNAQTSSVGVCTQPSLTGFSSKTDSLVPRNSSRGGRWQAKTRKEEGKYKRWPKKAAGGRGAAAQSRRCTEGCKNSLETG